MSDVKHGRRIIRLAFPFANTDAALNSTRLAIQRTLPAGLDVTCQAEVEIPYGAVALTAELIFQEGGGVAANALLGIALATLADGIAPTVSAPTTSSTVAIAGTTNIRKVSVSTTLGRQVFTDSFMDCLIRRFGNLAGDTYAGGLSVVGILLTWTVSRG